MALRHRVELDAAVFRPGHLEDAHRVVVEDERVRVVVDHENVVLLGEGDELLEGLHARVAARGHVRIVGPHHLHARQVHALELVEVGLPPVVLTEVIVDDLRAEDLVHSRISGIAGIGDEHFVAGVAEGEGDIHDTLLGADDGLDLGHGIHRHAIDALVEACHGAVELRQAARGLIAVGMGGVRHLAELVDGLLRRRHVGRADGEGDDVLTLGIELHHFFQLTAEIVFLDTVYS